MTNYKNGLRPTIGVLTGWYVYQGYLDSFLDELLRGIQSAARIHDCNLLLACGIEYGRPGFDTRSAWPVNSTETDFVPVGHWNTDGLIVVQPLLLKAQSQYIQEVMSGGHPVLFMGMGEQDLKVVPDNLGGVRQAIEHLVAHGHRRIAFISGDDAAPPSDSAERLAAFRTAVGRFGLDDDPRLVAGGGHNTEGGHQAMLQLLASGVSFSAVLASNDSSAIGAMEALREAGRRIPQDVAIIGIDNRPEAVTLSPPLTSVKYPTFRAGYRALEMMHRWVDEGPDFLAKEDLILGMELVRRRSCGCQPNGQNPGFLDSQPGLPTAKKRDVDRVISNMVETLSLEGMHLSGEEISILCNQFLDETIDCIRTGNAAQFRMVIEEVIDRVGALRDNPATLQTVIPILETAIPTLFQGEKQTSLAPFAGMLKEARKAVEESTHRYNLLHASWGQWAINRVELLTKQLQTALEEERIFELLMQGLSQLFIKESHFIYYEAEAGDPVGRSMVRSSSQPGLTGKKFSTRQFPPAGFYPDDSPYQLALVPLVVQTEGIGFAAFEATKLEICGAIIRQLAAALKGAWLFHDAVESRKLAEEADQMKSRFLSTVSHELRTPLNLIVGLSDLILQEGTSGLPPSYRRDIEQIHNNAEHLGRLIRDVLDLATSQAGKLRLNLERLDLVETLRPAIKAGKELTRQKNLEWKALLPKTHPMVMGDGTRLRQVLLNLISNAVKFTESGQIEVKIEVQEEEALISVHDTGLGIPLEEQAIIFDEFRQSERSTARGFGGMGLGLAISKRLMELHKGRIGVQSSGQEGAGSTFFFGLPVSKDPGPSAPAVSHRIVLLARQASASQSLQQRLMQQGFEVELLLANEIGDWSSRVIAAPPGAIVVDGLLAAEKGWDILKLLKENPTTRQTPVLFYNMSEEADNGALLELDYLMKPLGEAELGQVLSQQGFTDEGREKARTILVVDDEPGTLSLHVRMVQTLSPKYEVLTAQNGREALEVIRRTLPDLVLLDLMMPEMDGFAVLEAMRAGETTREIPVVVLTAQVLTETDMARLNQGVAAVLGKGIFNREETLAHIQDALGRQQRLGNETQRLMRKVMAYLHTHYAEPITREALANHVGIHKNYLMECFRQETGMTLSAYLTRYRINQAKILLVTGEQSVAEVAEAVGFSDISNFSRAFKQEVKISPGAYRRGQRSGNPPG